MSTQQGEIAQAANSDELPIHDNDAINFTNAGDVFQAKACLRADIAAGLM